MRTGIGLFIALFSAALVVVSCGSSQASTPEQAAMSFYQAYKDDDNDALQKLATREYAAIAQAVCNGSLVACVTIESKVPERLSISSDPQARTLEQDAITANVEMRFSFSDGVDEAAAEQCQMYAAKREGEVWHIASIQGFRICPDHATATAAAMNATQQAQRDEAIAAQQAQVAASTATQQAQDADATATQQALPTAIPEVYLTARQALLQSGVRAQAQQWSADAALINVALSAKIDSVFSSQDVALDGTSRLWAFQFASAQLQKTIWFTVQSGVVTEQSDNDAAAYKEIFAAKGEPFDIKLEEYLDSDQAVAIARENKATTTDSKMLLVFLTINPNNELLAQPPALWSVGIRQIFGGARIRLNGITGEIVLNDFGPTGSPGAIPTPLAAPSGNAAPQPPAGSAATPAATPAAAAAGQPLVPAALFASGTAPAATDAQGNPVSYDARNVADGQPETTWRVSGDGVGRRITMLFDQPVRLSELKLIPGYAKIDPVDGTNRFTQNRRVKRATLEFTNKQTVAASFEDKPEMQSVRFDPVVTSFVRITVEETTPPSGADPRDFTAISEASAVGQVCGDDCGALADDIRTLLASRPKAGLTAVEGVAGDYARLFTESSDGAWLFVKRQGSTWELVTSGTFFPPETLERLGIPPALWFE